MELWIEENHDTIGIFGLSRREKETWASIVIQGIKPGMEKIVCEFLLMQMPAR